MEKTAIVTGASRGIGAAIARKLASEGFHLTLCCRQQQDKLEALAKELTESSGLTPRCLTGDVADPSFAEELLKGTEQIGLLVNNAGISHVGLLQDMTNDEWARLMNVNLSSAFYLSRAVIPKMLAARSGRIINISSVWGRVGASMEVAYSASKGALDAMTRALARELAPSGIAVNALACGYIDTEMNAHLSPEEKKALGEEIPAGRAGTPEEVAECVSLLAKAPVYLTGQVLTLDGAWT
ncbi:MAG: SDR family NAD(P)-dependent oxidoreductase [Lachnospiraceae bacterium]|nr:SDR family NAD(P)-dependent oxidoreductase [Lachnospiraceae bacterium]